ncbi:MAG: AAA family ATPase, partial [Xanthobacteraceae bacterium]
MRTRLRVFISSPGDVPAERLRAALVIDKLAQDYSRFFEIEAFRWESEPMLASGHFQDLIDPPSRHDIVILILWSRLGTPLPEKTAVREYRGIDDRAPVTGTEWEFEDALRAAQLRGAPDILAFRNTNPAPVDTQDLEAQARGLAQLNALNEFWSRHFADRGVFLAAYDGYRTIDEFAQRLEESLRKLLERRIKTLDADLRDQPPLWLSTPFRGLEPYEFEHAAIYFGRDALVARGIEALAARAREGTAFLMVSGASGSGKSSLVKAAIVPRLMRPQRIEGAAFVRRLVYRPGDGGGDIVQGLVEALTRGAGADGIGLPELLAPGQSAQALAAALRAAPDRPEFIFSGALNRVAETSRREGRILSVENAKLVLVIDQLEELFTIAAIGEEDRRIFVRLLAGLAHSGEVWIVATMRADFWHCAAEMRELVALCEGNGRLDVTAPSPAEITEMIRRPAEAAGLLFEQHAEHGVRLDSVIAERAAAAPGVLPLLSFTLEALYAEDVDKRGGH